MYLTLTLNFEAVTILMSEILDFPVSLDLYNSLDTLLDNLVVSCFPNLAFYKTRTLKNSCRKLQ